MKPTGVANGWDDHKKIAGSILRIKSKYLMPACILKTNLIQPYEADRYLFNHSSSSHFIFFPVSVFLSVWNSPFSLLRPLLSLLCPVSHISRALLALILCFLSTQLSSPLFGFPELDMLWGRSSGSKGEDCSRRSGFGTGETKWK